MGWGILNKRIGGGNPKSGKQYSNTKSKGAKTTKKQKLFE